MPLPPLSLSITINAPVHKGKFQISKIYSHSDNIFTDALTKRIVNPQKEAHQEGVKTSFLADLVNLKKMDF